MQTIKGLDEFISSASSRAINSHCFSTDFNFIFDYELQLKFSPWNRNFLLFLTKTHHSNETGKLIYNCIKIKN